MPEAFEEVWRKQGLVSTKTWLDHAKSEVETRHWSEISPRQKAYYFLAPTAFTQFWER